jgi:hypothetical protein
MWKDAVQRCTISTHSSHARTSDDERFTVRSASYGWWNGYAAVGCLILSWSFGSYKVCACRLASSHILSSIPH